MNLSDPLQPSGPMPPIAGQTLQPGDRVEGFEILHLLGLTSFGALYTARSAPDGLTVALKEYMPSSLAVRSASGQVSPIDSAHTAAFERGLQAFLNEALTLSQFDHPHLLRVSAIFEANGTGYRSMPYLTGSTLLALRTHAQEPVSQAQLQQLLEGLLGALRTLYQGGIAHGMVEPINIFLLDDGQPVLMDFDAVHQAVLSDPTSPYVDAYADPARTPSLVTADLHAVAAVLHYAVSGDWVAPRADACGLSHAPLPEVLQCFKGSASVLGYQPEFLAAIDKILALPLAERPGTVTEFRALFESEQEPPQAQAQARAPDAAAGISPAPPEGESALPRARREKRAPVSPSSPVQLLSASESVLALLANFDRGPAPAAEDVEPFETPEVPTLTDEAEPALPPLRDNPFDHLEAAAEQPAFEQPAFEEQARAYVPLSYAPMPRVPHNVWQRRLIVAAMVAGVLATVGGLGWLLVS